MIQQSYSWTHIEKKKIIIQNEYMHSNIHCSIIYNSHDTEAA